MSGSDYWEYSCTRLWALDKALKRNRYSDMEKVIKEAERFHQFIENRSDAKIQPINNERRGR